MMPKLPSITRNITKQRKKRKKRKSAKARTYFEVPYCFWENHPHGTLLLLYGQSDPRFLCLGDLVISGDSQQYVETGVVIRALGMR
jgi:hypothetical protein